MKMISRICLSTLFILASVSAYDSIAVGELPEEVITELKQLQTRLTVDLKAKCRKPQAVQVRYLLYTRESSNVSESLCGNNTSKIDPTKKAIFLIHGWLSKPISSGVLQLKDVYLKRYDCNVIVVDWSEMSLNPYTVAYCHVPKIGNHVAKFLCETGLPLKEVHVVGHSMGGQIAGVVGHLVNGKCQQKLGRITGLDPSGPLFQNAPDLRRLDKSDAHFVDVIHSDQMKYGFSGNCGGVDFHPNCGQLQPGCSKVTSVNDSTLLSDIFCSHHRSLEYMVESVITDDFIAVSCGLCPRYCGPNIINEDYVVMGEGCPLVPPSTTKFYLRTKSSPPYAEGWARYNGKPS